MESNFSILNTENDQLNQSFDLKEDPSNLLQSKASRIGNFQENDNLISNSSSRSPSCRLLNNDESNLKTSSSTSSFHQIKLECVQSNNCTIYGDCESMFLEKTILLFCI